MTIGYWLSECKAQLESAGIITARLDALILLEDMIGKDRAWLLSHPEYELQGSEIEFLSTKVAQRAQHVPLAYIRGHAEFYGHDFLVNDHTLVPRPETEAMVELLRKTISNHSWDTSEMQLIDIGTGSGAIAITAKLAFPDATAYAIDIDENCLAVARKNAAALGAEVTFLEGNLVQPLVALDSRLSNAILLCNLPYVPDSFHINTAASHEPKHALFGGPDGLDLYRQMFKQITTDTSWKPTLIFTESLPTQHVALADIARSADYQLVAASDFIQLFGRGTTSS